MSFGNVDELVHVALSIRPFSNLLRRFVKGYKNENAQSDACETLTTNKKYERDMASSIFLCGITPAFWVLSDVNWKISIIFC